MLRMLGKHVAVGSRSVEALDAVADSFLSKALVKHCDSMTSFQAAWLLALPVGGETKLPTSEMQTLLGRSCKRGCFLRKGEPCGAVGSHPRALPGTHLGCCPWELHPLLVLDLCQQAYPVS